MSDKTKSCQGYRRYGGAFTLGPVRWKKCKKSPVVILTVIQGGKTESLAACAECWKECKEKKITIKDAKPI